MIHQAAYLGSSGRIYTDTVTTVDRYQFTREDAIKGADASNAIQQARALDRRRRSEHVAAIINDVPTDDLPALWHGIAVDLALHAVQGELPEVHTTQDVERLVNAADKLHKMGRLASGQSTSNSAHLDVNDLASKLRDRAHMLDAMDVDTTPAS